MYYFRCIRKITLNSKQIEFSATMVPEAGVEPAPCRQDRILSHTLFRWFLGIDMYLEVAGTLYKAHYFKHFWQQICKKVLFVCYSLPSFIKEHKIAVWRDIRGTFDLYI